MSIQHSPDSNYAKEMAKWEMEPTSLVPRDRLVPRERGGHYPFVFQEFPKALSKATQKAGRVEFEEFNVHDANEQANMESRGWCVGRDKALEALRASELNLATLAANVNYNDRTMSDKAKAEAAAVKAQHAVHLGEVPETPIKRRVRRAKTE